MTALDAITATDLALQHAAYRLAVARMTKDGEDAAQRELRVAALNYARAAAAPFRIVDREAREENRGA